MEIQLTNKAPSLKHRSAAVLNFAGIKLAHNGAVKLAKKLIRLAIVLNPEKKFYKRNYKYVISLQQASKVMISLNLLNKLDKSRNLIASLLNKIMLIFLNVGNTAGKYLINYAIYLNPTANNFKKNQLRILDIINHLNRLLPVTFKTYRTQLLSVKEWCHQQKLPFNSIKTDQQFFITAPVVFEPPSNETHTGAGTTAFPDIYLAKVENATVIAGSSLILVDDKRITLYDELTYVEPWHYGISNRYARSVQKDIVDIDIANGDEPKINEAIHFCKDYSNNYYHWLVECLPRFWIIDQYPELKNLPLIVDNELFAQQKEVLDLLNINKHPIIYLKRSIGYQVNHLYIPSPLSLLNDNYTAPVDYAKDTLISPIAVNYMRENVLKNLGLPAKSGYRKLFISRKLATYRHIINANEIERYMIDQGFEIVYAEHLSFANQVTLFSQAKIIVGQEGAGMANLIFAPKDCKVMILINHHPQTNYYEFTLLAQVVNIDLLFVPGDDVIRNVDHNKHNNFKIDITKFSKALQSL